MKLFTKICCMALILIGSAGCAADEHSVSGGETADVKLRLSAGGWQTRAFTNDPESSQFVERILVIPFVKADDTQPDIDDTNFVPVQSQIMQYDVAAFPFQDVELRLMLNRTYKILVVGYNTDDYDYNDAGNADNTFSLTPAVSPTLQTYGFAPKYVDDNGNDTYLVNEMFSGLCVANGTDEAFSVEDDMTVECTLKRLVGGFSVEITDIPAEVTSMTLRCNAVATQAAFATTYNTVTTGSDGGSDIFLVQATPSNGAVTLDKLMMPLSDYQTGFAIEIAYSDNSTAVYAVKAVDQGSGETIEQFEINPNLAINLSGSYSNLELGFIMNTDAGIGLDDDQWDGYTDSN